MPGLSAHSRARQKLGTKPVSDLSKTKGGRIVIAKKPAKTREKHQHHKGGRSPFWVRGTAQPRAPVEERALSVFQPDILVEHQYQSTYRRRFHLDPERVLMLALLQDAGIRRGVYETGPTALERDGHRKPEQEGKSEFVGKLSRRGAVICAS